jgi:hypothetical protein
MKRYYLPHFERNIYWDKQQAHPLIVAGGGEEEGGTNLRSTTGNKTINSLQSQRLPTTAKFWNLETSRTELK